MAEYLDQNVAEEQPKRQPYATDRASSEKYHRKWMDEIARAERYFKTWMSKGETVIKLYRKQNETERSKRKFAMLWANTEVMKPTIYARAPEPQIARRFKDQDPAARIASDLLERACSYVFEKADIDSALKSARDDVLLPGRGTVWVRYIKDGELAIDYIHWRDFLHSPARRWEEVWWVAKRAYMDKQSLMLRFPDADLKDISPDNVPKSSGISDEERKTLEGKYSVWEIWDKRTGRVCWIAPSMPVPLDVEEEPILNLDSFWPTPKPIYSTTTTDSLIPIPDYKYYQDQAEEIDDLTRRIGSLTDGLKLVGFYPRGSESTTEIEKALDPSVENRMIGVESWAAFSDRGGGKQIIFLPIEQVVATIQACVELRRQLIEDVYQITGISDIMRGATDPNETLGAQQLKAQTGSIRVRDRQQEIQRFARDTLRIMAEIIAEKFSPEILLQMTNMANEAIEQPQMQPGPPPDGAPGGMMPPGMPPPSGMPGAPPMGGPMPGTPPMGPPPEQLEKIQNFTKAIALLKDEKTRGFRIDIETDSTIQMDEDAEKQRRVEFATAVGGLLKEGVPMAQQVPELIPLVGATIQFVVRGFRADELEDIIDKTMKELEGKAKAAAQNPQIPPEIELEKQRMETIDGPKAAAEAALANARAQQISVQTQIEPAKLAMEQDKMILGEAARQEERTDGLQAEENDRAAAQEERQGEAARWETERADDLDAAATKREDALTTDALDRDERAQEAAAAGGPAGAGQPAQAGAAPVAGRAGGVGPPPAGPQMSAGGQTPGMGMVAQLLQQLALSTQQNSQAIAQLAEVMASPTVVDTPRGQYVARKALNGGPQ